MQIPNDGTSVSGILRKRFSKKTAQCSTGLEGIDTSEPRTCETCHLNKAQRFVSREPRPTPNDALDEVL